MSGIAKNSLRFINSLFKQAAGESKSTSTKDKDKTVLADLNKTTQNNIKIIADNIVKTNKLLGGIYEHITGIDPRALFIKHETKRKEEPKSKKTEYKPGESKEDKLSKRKQKQVDKAQKKVQKKTDPKKSEHKALKTTGLILEAFYKFSKEVISKISKYVTGLAKDSVNLASKSITSSSIVIDKELRSMQIGMGLSNKGAMSLSGAMKTLNIDKSDLAYLTQGQRDALNSINSMYTKLYDSVNMDAISKLGNDIYMLQAKASVLQEAIRTQLINMLTVIDPLIETAINVLDEVFDAVNEIFSSPEFKQIMQDLSSLVITLVNNLMPLIDTVMGLLKSVLPIIAQFVTSVLKTLMPIIKVVVDILGKLFEVVAKIITPILGILMNLINVIAMIMPMINSLLDAVAPLLQLIAEVINDVLEMLMPVLEVVLNLVGELVNTVVGILKPVILILASLLQTVIMVVSEILTGLMPIINFIADLISGVLDVLMPIINIIAVVLTLFANSVGETMKQMMAMLGPIFNIFTKILTPSFKLITGYLKLYSNVMYQVSRIITKLANVVISIKNKLTKNNTKKFEMPKREEYLDISSTIELNPSSSIASTYAGTNNTTSISNKNTNVDMNVSFNQTVSGTASQYAETLAKQNYESNQVLSKLLESAL